MKKRYCVLSPDYQLRVFADETKNQELGAVDLHYSTDLAFHIDLQHVLCQSRKYKTSQLLL